nr:GNAT family N-acetyltransferase [Agrobacterium tumefaciens]
MQYYAGIKSHSETRAWFEELAFDSYSRHGFGLWAVVDATSNEIIGDCGITLQQTPAGLEPEIGYHLWREFWGQGFATEAAIACRDYAFQILICAEWSVSPDLTTYPRKRSRNASTTEKKSIRNDSGAAARSWTAISVRNA